MKDAVVLFHVGFSEIRRPDLKIGRKNADFGQGFYLSDDAVFSKRWAKTRRGEETRLNRYVLELNGLNIRRFERNEAWYDYIFSNRAGRADTLTAYDAIVGPIANDTLYDTWGVLTSGLIGRETALELLRVGPVYRQTAIKTEKAAAALRFLDSVVLQPEEIAAFREAVFREEAAFQEAFARRIGELPEFRDESQPDTAKEEKAGPFGAR